MRDIMNFILTLLLLLRIFSFLTKSPASFLPYTMKRGFSSLLGILVVLNKKSGRRKSSDCSQPSALPEGICREFSLAEIKAATNNFHPELIVGHGDYGRVYRGTVDDGTMVVAVKLLKINSSQRVEEFRTELQMLCQLRHPHLVSLIGFCHEQNKMILVYEYMNTSLHHHLYAKDCAPLDWNHRLQICIGAARGLHYLHTGAKRAVIHRHINSSNILLDDEGSAKLCDLALSKLGPLSISKALIKMKESKIVGTIGYIAPEYVIHGELTEKSDVYSFGVILFEVLCSRRAYDSTLPENQQHVVEWARKLAREGTMYNVIDPYLKGKIAPECLKKYWEIACSCVHKEGDERPAMGEVEVTLELALELQKKADSEMEGIAPRGECMYEEASLSANFDMHSDFFLLPDLKKFERQCGVISLLLEQ